MHWGSQDIVLDGSDQLNLTEAEALSLRAPRLIFGETHWGESEGKIFLSKMSASEGVTDAPDFSPSLFHC